MPAVRILILDDDDALVRLYAKYLRKSGHEVQYVRTLPEAHDQIEANVFDIFLCDMRVGEENGLDLLREEWESLKKNQTEVIVMTGYAEYRDAIRLLGVKHFLYKPITGYELTQEVTAIANEEKLN